MREGPLDERMDGGAPPFDAAPPPPRKDRRRQESAPAADGPIAQQRAGHRERLRRHFLENLPGEIRMRDYELLELLLFGAYPRRDVQPIARDLIRKFDSVAGVLAAEPSALKEVKHVGEVAVSLIKVAEALGIELARQRALGGDLLENHGAVIDYCRARMARRPVEEFRILFMDNRNRLIRDERQTVGTINHAPAYPREVCRRALEVGASSVILVHNHPSGDPSPSRADIEVTRRIVEAAKTLGIGVHDHFIVTPDEVLSFKTRGLL